MGGANGMQATLKLVGRVRVWLWDVQLYNAVRGPRTPDTRGSRDHLLN